MASIEIAACDTGGIREHEHEHKHEHSTSTSTSTRVLSSLEARTRG